MSLRSKGVLIILDGFGIGKDSPFNAIRNARIPFFNQLLKKYPHSQLWTHGPAVGLPEGVMGNSEVGHSTLGSGQIIYQSLLRISRSIEDGSFFENQVLIDTFNKASERGGRIHLMGLLSDGGVHSHIDHLKALLDMATRLKIPEVSLHLFMDGRDTPPDSGVEYLSSLEAHPTFQKGASTKAMITSISGRYFAMDRDKREERTQKALLTLCGQTGPVNSTPEQVLQSAYDQEIGDEFIEPTLLNPSTAIQNGDAVIFFNFRADRARQISEALFGGNTVKLSAFTGMTEYDESFPIPAAFSPISTKNILGEVLEKEGLSQFRIAETEKYAHVTFFFNGGREEPFKGEDRLLIPSPKDVETYDLKPEMSAPEVALEAVKKIEAAKHHFVLMNFANGDMVGHTGNYEASLKAVECLDQCLEKVIGAAERNGYELLLTADHGNCEEMRDSNGKKHTQHTLNPVPLIHVPPGSANAPATDRRPLNDGNLSDIMPTLCNLMGLQTPKEVTGKSLFQEE